MRYVDKKYYIIYIKNVYYKCKNKNLYSRWKRQKDKWLYFIRRTYMLYFCGALRSQIKYWSSTQPKDILFSFLAMKRNWTISFHVCHKKHNWPLTFNPAGWKLPSAVKPIGESANSTLHSQTHVPQTTILLDFHESIKYIYLTVCLQNKNSETQRNPKANKWCHLRQNVQHACKLLCK